MQPPISSLGMQKVDYKGLLLQIMLLGEDMLATFRAAVKCLRGTLVPLWCQSSRASWVLWTTYSLRLPDPIIFYIQGKMKPWNLVSKSGMVSLSMALLFWDPFRLGWHRDLSTNCPTALECNAIAVVVTLTQVPADKGFLGWDVITLFLWPYKPGPCNMAYKQALKCSSWSWMMAPQQQCGHSRLHGLWCWEPQPCKPLSLVQELTHIYWILWPEIGRMLDWISIFHSLIEHTNLHGVLGFFPSPVWRCRSIPPFVEIL